MVLIGFGKAGAVFEVSNFGLASLLLVNNLSIAFLCSSLSRNGCFRA